ncbi:MAG: polysaccharide deacetylase family protein [Patulibacter minatonensis]
MGSRRRSAALPLALGALIAGVGGVAAGLLLAGPGEDDSPPQRITTTPSERTKANRGGGTSTTRTTTPGGPSIRGEKARQARIPILMYHVLGTPSGSSLPDLWVSKERFREQMAALKAAGYQGITLKAAFGAWETGGPLPPKPVIVSFDDGYLSHATVAAPTLRKYGWPGVLNLELKNLGKDGLPRHLALEMANEGWEIDSHTLTHPDLRNVSAEQLKTELDDSRVQIKQIFGTAPQYFCYPAGKYDARVIAAVKAAGYAGATTVEPGLAGRSNGKYELPRVRITNADSGTGLVQRLRDAG